MTNLHLHASRGYGFSGARRVSGEKEGCAVATCSQCGSAVTDGATFCPVCGTPQTEATTGAPPAAETPPAAAPPPGAGAPPPGAFGTPPAGAGYGAPPQSGFGGTAGGLAFDLKRLTMGDLVAGGGSLLLFIFLFLPWYTASFEGLSASTNALGSGAGGYRFLILIVSLVTIAYVVARSLGLPRQLPQPLLHWQVLIGLTGLDALLTVISFFDKPSGGGIVSVGWGAGAFLGLIAALGALGGAIWEKQGAPAVGATR